MAFYPAVLVPIGNQNLGFSSGHVQYFLPIWLQKDFGLWTVYGGGGYWINPGAGNKNYWFTGVAVWRKITEQLELVSAHLPPDLWMAGACGTSLLT